MPFCNLAVSIFFSNIPIWGIVKIMVPFLGPLNWAPKRDHNFDNPPYESAPIFTLHGSRPLFKVSKLPVD